MIISNLHTPFQNYSELLAECHNCHQDHLSYTEQKVGKNALGCEMYHPLIWWILKDTISSVLICLKQTITSLQTCLKYKWF